jgi:4-hydroxy-2-oxoheptanedioate aldolase
MFPRIDTLEDAERTVAAMHYPTRGVRGVASTTRACGYGANFRPYLAGCANILNIVQIESPAALALTDAIARLDGIDVLFVGPFDLSFTMGILGEFDHPDFMEAVRATAESARRHQKHAGILLPVGHPIQRYHLLGYRFIVFGSDAMLLSQAARAAAQTLQEQRSRLEKAL